MPIYTQPTEVALLNPEELSQSLLLAVEEAMRAAERYDERTASAQPAPGKWSVKEILGHVADAERVFTYRALRIARGDQTPLPGFEQDDYVRVANSGKRKLMDIVEEFSDVRHATLSLFRSFSPDSWLRRGTASNHEVSVRALPYITAGHELHHRRVLEERYFPAIPRA